MGNCHYVSLHSLAIEAKRMHWFHSSFKKKSLNSNQNIRSIHYSEQARRCDSPVPDLFHLVHNSWGYYELNIRGCHSSPASAQCTNTKWSQCNYNFHAFMHGEVCVFWGNLMGSEKKGKINGVTDTKRMENATLSLPKTTSVTKRVFVLMVLSQLLTVEGASVMQIRIVFVTRWTFHSPSFNAACHGTLVVDSFPTRWNVPCNLWKPVSWLSVTARPANRNVSQLPLSHAAEINNLSPQINNNKRWKGNSHRAQNEFMEDRDSFSDSKPKTRKQCKTYFSVRIETNLTLVHFNGAAPDSASW